MPANAIDGVMPLTAEEQMTGRLNRENVGNGDQLIHEAQNGSTPGVIPTLWQR